MSSRSYAHWGYCLQINQDVVEAFNLTIKDVIEWYDYDDEDAIKDIEGCPDFLSALKRAAYHFGTGAQAKINVGEHTIFATIYEYNSDEGGMNDDLTDGLYFDFNEDDLYDKKPKPVLMKFREYCREPTFSTWVVS